MLVDTHCHIHTANSSRDDHTVEKWHDAGEASADKLLASAKAGGIGKMICVGTDLEDSVLAVEFAAKNPGCFSAIGVHPHEAKQFLAKHKNLGEFEKLIKKQSQSPPAGGNIVAVGEVGLDYFYEHSPKEEQKQLLEMFLGLAQTYDLPMIFHVREAFDDFWPILANFNKIRGVLHSFTSTEENLRKALAKDLYIGLNGIMTFTKDHRQLETAKKIPLERLLLETDAPYLAPKPMRGKVCKPEHVSFTYDFLSDLRGDNKNIFKRQIANNTDSLFKLSRN